MKFYMEKQFFMSFKLVFFGFLIRALVLELYRFTLVHLRWNKLYLHVLFCCFFITQFVELQKAKDICEKLSGIDEIFSHLLHYSISNCQLVCWTVSWSVHWSCIFIFCISGQFSPHCSCAATCNWWCYVYSLVSFPNLNRTKVELKIPQSKAMKSASLILSCSSIDPVLCLIQNPFMIMPVPKQGFRRISNS